MHAPCACRVRLYRYGSTHSQTHSPVHDLPTVHTSGGGPEHLRLTVHRSTSLTLHLLEETSVTPASWQRRRSLRPRKGHLAGSRRLASLPPSLRVRVRAPTRGCMPLLRVHISAHSVRPALRPSSASIEASDRVAGVLCTTVHTFSLLGHCSPWDLQPVLAVLLTTREGTVA